MIPLLVPLLLAVQEPVQLHGTGTLGLTHTDPLPGGGRETALVLEQAMVRAALRNGPWRGWASVSLEGLTMPDGAPNPGAFGEGFIDVRHPHTFVHELLAGVVVPAGGARVSLTAGKGFAAFGTDDPMHRPALKYPVNHHWAQLLERWVVVAGVAAGPVLVEGTLLNGDEPERPEDWPRLRRFGDSWAARLTLRPAAGVETQASYAFVRSPEHRDGAGPDARKWSASAALARALAGGSLRALGEWALTDEADGAYRFTSLLGELEWRSGGHRPYARVEWTSRPEEERTADLTRTVRPHVDDHLAGITRFTIVTAGYGYTLAVGGWRIEPLAEAAFSRVREVAGGLFDPAAFYGRSTLMSLTVAVRLHRGTGTTMGRYGVQEPLTPEPHAHH